MEIALLAVFVWSDKIMSSMHTDKEGFEKILSKYSKVVDPGMLEGTVQYAYDFVEKIPLVKREAFQVTLDLVGEKRTRSKTGSAESVLRQ